MWLLAALFSLPPGIGVALATLRVTGGEDVILSAVAGSVVTAAVALLVIGLTVSGRPDPAPDGPHSR